MRDRGLKRKLSAEYLCRFEVRNGRIQNCCARKGTGICHWPWLALAMEKLLHGFMSCIQLSIAAD